MVATLFLATVLLGACEGSPDATGGLTGRVLAGPTCPVEIEGSPCPPSPWRGTVMATAADGTTYEAESDAAGRYGLALPPGSYVVTAVTGTSGLPTAVPVEVTVGEGPAQRLDLDVDTGIR